VPRRQWPECLFLCKLLFYFVILLAAEPASVQMVGEYRESERTFQAFACGKAGLPRLAQE
jgi:hypothetical protein